MIRVVVYAEGAGEGAGAITQLPPVGEPLRDEQLGAVHELVRLAIVEEWQVAADAVRFDAPQRTHGRLARGSDLLSEARLRGLLVWPKPKQQPDLAVLCVDADGKTQRGTQLRAMLEAIAPRLVTLPAVPVQEFEAWLIADDAAVRDVLGAIAEPVQDPEALAPRDAKRRLAAALGSDANAGAGREQRRRIAQHVRLETLRTRCPAFAKFLQDLRSRRPMP